MTITAHAWRGVCVAATLGTMLAGCGSPAPSSSAARTPTAAASASTTPSGGGSLPPFPSNTTPASLVLSTDALPSGGPAWQQISQGEINNEASSYEKTWANPDNSERVEVDVLVDDSVDAASSDYGTWRDGVKGKLSGTTASSCPSDAPPKCNQFVGTTSTGSNEVIIAYALGQALVGIVLNNTSGAADASYAQAVGAREGQLIATVANG